MKPLAVWSSAIGALVAYDVWCTTNDIEGDSLSECIRATLRTDTREGQALFVLGWSALSAWFVPHIIRKVESVT